jgi:Winged helix-turn helix
MLLPLAGGSGTVVTFGEFIMILELHRQGLKVAAIARQLGVDRKTVRKYISRGLEPPAYGPRPRRQKSTDPFLPAQGALSLGLGEGADEITKRGEVDAASGFDGLHAERQRQMALAGARWAEEVYDLATIDELQLGERHDAVFVERGLEREVEASERLNCGEACHHQRDLDAAVLTQRELLSEQCVDGFDGGHLAAFEAAHGDVEDLDRPWHLQADQGLLDAIDERGNDLGMGVHRTPR